MRPRIPRGASVWHRFDRGARLRSGVWAYMRRLDRRRERYAARFEIETGTDE